MTGDPVGGILGKLEKVHKNGNGWTALCPAHDDVKSSLSIREADDGKVLLKCFAGCEPQDIVGRLGLTMQDLFPPSHNGNGRSRIVKTYDYKAPDGTLLYQSVRFDPKDFRPRRPDPKGGWVWDLKNTERVLYRFSELADEGNKRIVFIVEGEKDVDRLMDAGLLATTNSGGAGQWLEEYSEALAGRKIVILPDNDEPGRKHVRKVSQSLLGLAEWIKIVELPDLPIKGDVSDWLGMGHTVQELKALVTKTSIVIEDDTVTPDPIPITRDTAIPGLVRLSDVEPEMVEWLWPGRIPLGKLTILDGDPGLGKSMVTCDIAARVSTGREMPDGTFGDMDGPVGVVLLSAEDGLADTIRPRLNAAGADCTRIAALTHVVEKETGLMKAPSVADLHEIEVAIFATEAKLIIIDPVVAYLPEKTKSHNDQDVRRVLVPLAQLAERNHVAVWLLRHLNKAPGGNPLYRGGGSIAFIGAVRSGLIAAQDPEDDTGERRIIASTKSNLARAAQALAYHVETAENGAARIVWEGMSDQTATSLLTSIDPDEKSQLAEAVEFLRDLLMDGEVKSTEVQARSKAAGVSFTTLKRAKMKLKVRAERRGMITDAHWVWLMPPKDQEDH